MTKAEFIQRYMLMRAGVDTGSVQEDYEIDQVAANILESNNFNFDRLC